MHPAHFIRELAPLFGILFQLSDWRSRKALLGRKMRRRRGDIATEEPIVVRADPVGELAIRPRTTDGSLIYGHLRLGQHRPPSPVKDWDMRQICDIGTNIGVGLLDYGVTYRHARLLGVEADPTSAGLARRNLARLDERCELVEAAVWREPGWVEMSGGQPGRMEVSEELGPTQRRVRAITMDELLAEHMPEGTIDFVHFDIVGAEPEIIKPGASWARRVRAIMVQLYDDPDVGFDLATCMDVLGELGFEPQAGRGRYHGDYVLGIRSALS